MNTEMNTKKEVKDKMTSPLKQLNLCESLEQLTKKLGHGATKEQLQCYSFIYAIAHGRIKITKNYVWKECSEECKANCIFQKGPEWVKDMFEKTRDQGQTKNG